MSFDPIKNDYDLVYWHKEEVISFHIIYHLCKFLGFDLLTFTPLDDAIFDLQNKGKFFRFHFRALPFRKMSSHVWDILVISKDNESTYNRFFQSMNPRISEAFFQGIIKAFDDLVNLKDEHGILLDINYDIINKFLRKHFGSEFHLPLRHWKKQGSLDDSIKTFNQWKRIITSHGYEQFLKNSFKQAYKNHFNQINGLTLTNALATQQDVDLLNKIYQKNKLKFKFEP
ncbi:MAG: hypothetical protein ACXABO_19770 [Promethearchaeota archaeon]|jgi:hypothetical protein